MFFAARWSFKSAEAARQSSEAIYETFVQYGAEGDFVGMDVARKHLRMGYAWARRYARYAGGNKMELLDEPDP